MATTEVLKVIELNLREQLLPVNKFYPAQNYCPNPDWYMIKVINIMSSTLRGVV